MALKVDGRLVAYLTVITEQVLHGYGRIIPGEFQVAPFKEESGLLKQSAFELSLFDVKVEGFCTG